MKNNTITKTISDTEDVLGILNRFSILKDNGIKVIPGSVYQDVAERIVDTIVRSIAERESDETGFIKFDLRCNRLTEHLTEKEVKSIAAKICRVLPEDIAGKSRKEELVCARWLVVHYFDRFADMSRYTQGAMIGKDHTTATNICINIDNWTGWRRNNLRRFENIINSIHAGLEIKGRFK